MSKPVYSAAKRRCSCHPETCCCDTYVVIDQNDRLVVSTNDRDNALMVAEGLNLLMEKRYGVVEPDQG